MNPLGFRPFGRLGEILATQGERARRAHARWLTRALTTGTPYPRIPLRRADQGGFDRLTGTAGGRRLAERWWELALARVDD